MHGDFMRPLYGIHGHYFIFTSTYIQVHTNGRTVQYNAHLQEQHKIEPDFSSHKSSLHGSTHYYLLK